MASQLCAIVAVLCTVALLPCGSVWAGGADLTPAKSVIPINEAAAVMQEQDVMADDIVQLRTDRLPGKTAEETETPHGEVMSVKLELPDLPVMPADADDEVENPVKKPPAEEEPKGEGEEDKNKETLEMAVNAEVLQQPNMARLARHLKSFHDYQVFQGRKQSLQRSANNIGRNYVEDEEDDGVVPEERAVRRRQRVRRRNSKNKVKRSHRNKHFANRRKSARRKQSNRNTVRRRNVKKSKSKRRRNRNYGGGVRRTQNNRRRSPSRRRNSNKAHKSSNGNNKRRSSAKKGSRKSSNKKRKSSKRRRKNNKNDSADQDTDTGRKQADAMPIGEDNMVQEAVIAAPAA